MSATVNSSASCGQKSFESASEPQSPQAYPRAIDVPITSGQVAAHVQAFNARFSPAPTNRASVSANLDSPPKFKLSPRRDWYPAYVTASKSVFENRLGEASKIPLPQSPVKSNRENDLWGGGSTARSRKSTLSTDEATPSVFDPETYAKDLPRNPFEAEFVIAQDDSTRLEEGFEEEPPLHREPSPVFTPTLQSARQRPRTPSSEYSQPSNDSFQRPVTATIQSPVLSCPPSPRPHHYGRSPEIERNPPEPSSPTPQRPSRIPRSIERLSLAADRDSLSPSREHDSPRSPALMEYKKLNPLYFGPPSGGSPRLGSGSPPRSSPQKAAQRRFQSSSEDIGALSPVRRRRREIWSSNGEESEGHIGRARAREIRLDAAEHSEEYAERGRAREREKEMAKGEREERRSLRARAGSSVSPMSGRRAVSGESPMEVFRTPDVGPKAWRGDKGSPFAVGKLTDTVAVTPPRDQDDVFLSPKEGFDTATKDATTNEQAQPLHPKLEPPSSIDLGRSLDRSSPFSPSKQPQPPPAPLAPVFNLPIRSSPGTRSTCASRGSSPEKESGRSSSPSKFLFAPKGSERSSVMRRVRSLDKVHSPTDDATIKRAEKKEIERKMASERRKTVPDLFDVKNEELKDTAVDDEASINNGVRRLGDDEALLQSNVETDKANTNRFEDTTATSSHFTFNTFSANNAGSSSTTPLLKPSTLFDNPGSGPGSGSATPRRKSSIFKSALSFISGSGDGHFSSEEKEKSGTTERTCRGSYLVEENGFILSEQWDFSPTTVNGSSPKQAAWKIINGSPDRKVHVHPIGRQCSLDNCPLPPGQKPTFYTSTEEATSTEFPNASRPADGATPSTHVENENTACPRRYDWTWTSRGLRRSPVRARIDTKDVDSPFNPHNGSRFNSSSSEQAALANSQTSPSKIRGDLKKSSEALYGYAPTIPWPEYQSSHYPTQSYSQSQSPSRPQLQLHSSPSRISPTRIPRPKTPASPRPRSEVRIRRATKSESMVRVHRRSYRVEVGSGDDGRSAGSKASGSVDDESKKGQEAKRGSLLDRSSRSIVLETLTKSTSGGTEGEDVKANAKANGDGETDSTPIPLKKKRHQQQQHAKPISNSANDMADASTSQIPPSYPLPDAVANRTTYKGLISHSLSPTDPVYRIHQHYERMPARDFSIITKHYQSYSLNPDRTPHPTLSGRDSDAADSLVSSDLTLPRGPHIEGSREDLKVVERARGEEVEAEVEGVESGEVQDVTGAGDVENGGNEAKVVEAECVEEAEAMPQRLSRPAIDTGRISRRGFRSHEHEDKEEPELRKRPVLREVKDAFSVRRADPRGIASTKAGARTHTIGTGRNPGITMSERAAEILRRNGIPSAKDVMNEGISGNGEKEKSARTRYSASTSSTARLRAQIENFHATLRREIEYGLDGARTAADGDVKGSRTVRQRQNQSEGNDIVRRQGRSNDVGENVEKQVSACEKEYNKKDKSKRIKVMSGHAYQLEREAKRKKAEVPKTRKQEGSSIFKPLGESDNDNDRNSNTNSSSNYDSQKFSESDSDKENRSPAPKATFISPSLSALELEYELEFEPAPAPALALVTVASKSKLEATANPPPASNVSRIPARPATISIHPAFALAFASAETDAEAEAEVEAKAEVDASTSSHVARGSSSRDNNTSGKDVDIDNHALNHALNHAHSQKSYRDINVNRNPNRNPASTLVHKPHQTPVARNISVEEKEVSQIQTGDKSHSGTPTSDSTPLPPLSITPNPTPHPVSTLISSPSSAPNPNPNLVNEEVGTSKNKRRNSRGLRVVLTMNMDIEQGEGEGEGGGKEDVVRIEISPSPTSGEGKRRRGRSGSRARVETSVEGGGRG